MWALLATSTAFGCAGPNPDRPIDRTTGLLFGIYTQDGRVVNRYGVADEALGEDSGVYYGLQYGAMGVGLAGAAAALGGSALGSDEPGANPHPLIWGAVGASVVAAAMVIWSRFVLDDGIASHNQALADYEARKAREAREARADDRASPAPMRRR